jgi:hypothetical protein
MTRETLPLRRICQRISFVHNFHEYVGSVSRFSDGRLAEVFLDAKSGDLDVMAKDMAVVTSLALQYGTPLEKILGALSQETDGTMCGPLGTFLQIMEELK